MKQNMFALCAAAAIIASCGSMYNYTFMVKNKLPVTIKAALTINNGNNKNRIDSFSIAAQTDTRVFTDENWGTVRNIAAPSDSVPAYTVIETLRIFISDSLKYVQSPVDFSQWEHTGTTTGPGASTYTFVVDTSKIK